MTAMYTERVLQREAIIERLLRSGSYTDLGYYKPAITKSKGMACISSPAARWQLTGSSHDISSDLHAANQISACSDSMC